MMVSFYYPTISVTDETTHLTYLDAKNVVQYALTTLSDLYLKMSNFGFIQP